VVHTGLGTFGPARSVLQKHAEISLANRELLQQQDLVVWPESSSDLDPFLDLESNRIIHDVQSALGVPLLMGANVELPQNGIANDSILWNGSNSTIVYQKRRLVPFGEFLPFRETLSRYTDRVALMPRDFVAGDSPGSISIKGIRLSVVICFEIADDSLAFDGTKDSSAIIVHTNNATYQNLGQSEQQLMSAQMRALETQRPVFSVSTSGISAVIDTSGSISKSLSQAETGILVAHIEEVQGSTLAMLLHPIFVSGILLSALYLIFRILRTRRVTP
jgi:apolipoprotein N-acyltransferase